MGRANIVEFLLRKGLGLNDFSNYLKKNLRESKYSVGSLNPGLLALMTMLSNKGVFSLD
jgi:hypothetical protein